MFSLTELQETAEESHEFGNSTVMAILTILCQLNAALYLWEDHSKAVGGGKTFPGSVVRDRDGHFRKHDSNRPAPTVCPGSGLGSASQPAEGIQSKWLYVFVCSSNLQRLGMVGSVKEHSLCVLERQRFYSIPIFLHIFNHFSSWVLLLKPDGGSILPKLFWRVIIGANITETKQNLAIRSLQIGKVGHFRIVEDKKKYWGTR